MRTFWSPGQKPKLITSCEYASRDESAFGKRRGARPSASRPKSRPCRRDAPGSSSAEPPANSCSVQSIHRSACQNCSTASRSYGVATESSAKGVVTGLPYGSALISTSTDARRACQRDVVEACDGEPVRKRDNESILVTRAHDELVGDEVKCDVEVGAGARAGASTSRVDVERGVPQVSGVGSTGAPCRRSASRGWSLLRRLPGSRESSGSSLIAPPGRHDLPRPEESSPVSERRGAPPCVGGTTAHVARGGDLARSPGVE